MGTFSSSLWGKTGQCEINNKLEEAEESLFGPVEVDIFKMDDDYDKLNTNNKCIVGDSNMSIEPVSKKSIWVYYSCDSAVAQEIVDNKELIAGKTMFESRDNANIAMKRNGFRGMVRCELNTTDCLDLLDVATLKDVLRFLEVAKENGEMGKSTNADVILRRYLKHCRCASKSIRYLETGGDGGLDHYKILTTACIKYRVLDVSSIGMIEILK